MSKQDNKQRLQNRSMPGFVAGILLFRNVVMLAMGMVGIRLVLNKVHADEPDIILGGPTTSDDPRVPTNNSILDYTLTVFPGGANVDMTRENMLATAAVDPVAAVPFVRV